MPNPEQSPNVQSLKNLAYYRQRLLATPKKVRHEVFPVTMEDGEIIPVEVRAPSLAQKQEIMEASTTVLIDKAMPSGVRGSVNLLERAARAAVACAFIPGTEEKIYTDADLKALREAPSGSWYEEVMGKAVKMLDPADRPEEAKSRLPQTPSASTSA